MLNKFDFEHGLKQDKQLIAPSIQLPINNQPGPGKANLFGPNPNLASGGYQIANDFQPSFQESQGQNKRDLLWEQKRKQKQEIINPPIMRDSGGSAAGMLDQMNPSSRQKVVMPVGFKNDQFQQALTFEQPKTVIEISQNNYQRGQTPQQEQQIIPNKQQQPFYQEFQPMIHPPQVQVLKQDSNNAWNQIAQYQQNQPQQVLSSSEPYFPMNTPPPQQNQFQDFSQILQGNDDGFRSPQNPNSPQNYDQPFNMHPQQQQQIQQMSQNNQNYQQQPQNYHQQPPQNQQQQQKQSSNNVLMHNNQQVEEKALKQKEYLMSIQNEIKEKEEKKKRDKEERIRKEREELQKNMNYNPFGRGGAGAPVRDNQGNINAQRKPIQNDQNQNSGQRYSNLNQPMQMPQQNMPTFNDPYSMQMPYQQPNMMYQQPIIQNQQQYQQFDQFPVNQQQVFPQQQQVNQQYQVYQAPQQQLPPVQQSFDFQQPYPPAQASNSTKQRAPEPTLSLKNEPLQDAGASHQNSLGIGAYQEIEKERQKNQKSELQNVLKQQMEEQKRRKEEDQRRLKEEELREEERIRRERQKIEDEYKQEENKKKAKFNEMQKANEQIIQNKVVVTGKKTVENEETNKSFVYQPSEQKQQKVEINGKMWENSEKKGNQRQNSQNQRQNNYEIENGNTAINHTRIINDISNELKHNFKEEISKLRDEMNSQQKAFREQLERLKIENTKTNNSKVEALTEIEKVKAELLAQRENERIQELKLINALEKHNPNKQALPLEILHNYDKPSSLPSSIKPIINNHEYLDQNPFNQIQPNYPQAQNILQINNSTNRKVESRLESRESTRKKQIDNYEKMFFGNPTKSQSQQRQIPMPPQYNIKEEKVVKINQEYFQPDVKAYKPYDYSHEPKIMKRSDSHLQNKLFKDNLDFNASLQGQSQFMGLDFNSHQLQHAYSEYNIPKKQEQPKIAFGPSFEEKAKDKESQQANNGYSFLENLKDMGAGSVRLDTQSAENTMDFVERIINGDQKKAKSNKVSNDRIANKFEDGFDFNFPKIPAYEGLQSDILLKKEEIKFQNPVKQDLSKPKSFQNENPDIFAQGLGAFGKALGDRNKNLLTEGSLNSLGTINSINLENLNLRNKERMQKLGIESLDNTQNTIVNFGDFNNYSSQPRVKDNTYQRGAQEPNDGLKNLDNLLYDIFRENDAKPYGSDTQQRVPSALGGKIPHINKRNSQTNINMMRGTRDQFMSPTMDLINEEGGEDYEGTFKAYNHNDNFDFKLLKDARGYDSFLDNTNIALD